VFVRRGSQFEVFWPGETTKKCLACAQKAIGIAQAMGFALDVRLIEDHPEPTSQTTTAEREV
jgi:hypothetical protein